MTSSLLPTYARFNLAFERGEGAWLYATNGDKYLDFGAGIAVVSVGHCHPHLVKALKEQGEKLWHVSNLFEIPQAEKLGARLVAESFADLVFFTNSGTEAMEGAIKTARRYQFVSGHPERYRIVTFQGAFHGRTLASVAAGGNPKYLEGFGPPLEGFDSVPFGDLAAVKTAITRETAAILIEPVQGEGGIRVATPDFLEALRALCDAHGLLLIFDEVQSGMGRTGKLFAYQHSRITPDIMGLAKGIGGGFPLGAFLTTRKVGACMTPGTHGTTYGGNPLATAVGNALLDVVLGEGFLAHVVKIGASLGQGLAELQRRYPDVIEEVRGTGLMYGLRVVGAVGAFVNTALEEKLITVPASDNVVRLLPPLTVNEVEIALALTRLNAVAEKISAQAKRAQRGAA
ncbi:acetylornithine transaminase [Methylovirgula ligni]|uniref:Acetylornithine aminotransferase n=1 Tax=Methylovirgula ligni TaxID=569860 RepID=A0A3D9ZCR3_9HYPH|nr:aspartate aminotransferase family protein [Methylovirgula ligni]QAY95420.1 acetylornithine transaminase [Methylovirgula ligni]REF89256.1 acetylornithine/N-succinyldiaminopimelate aminotransferase [Methylovirgula ligni]